MDGLQIGFLVAVIPDKRKDLFPCQGVESTKDGLHNLTHSLWTCCLYEYERGVLIVDDQGIVFPDHMQP